MKMVSNKLLLYIHQRFLDIFGYPGHCMKPFAGISVIVVGDLYQLPPVMQRPVYADYHDEMFNIYHLWRVFKMCGLEQVMRQRGDTRLIELLNNIRIGRLLETDINLLKTRLITKETENYPVHALHIFAENEPARQHNSYMLNLINSPQVAMDACDQVPKCVPEDIYDKILSLNQSQTNGLIFQLLVKVCARVMLTSNVDISDRLINGQIGTIVDLEWKNNKVDTIFIKFDDAKAGQKRKNESIIARRIDAVPNAFL